MTKNDFKNIGFEINLPVRMKITKQDKDNVVVSVDRKTIDKTLNKLSKEKMISVLLYSRGWTPSIKINRS